MSAQCDESSDVLDDVNHELHQVNRDLNRIREQIERRDTVPDYLKREHEDLLDRKRELLREADQ